MISGSEAVGISVFDLDCFLKVAIIQALRIIWFDAGREAHYWASGSAIEIAAGYFLRIALSAFSPTSEKR